MGTLEELGNLLLSLFSSLPPGTIILLGFPLSAPLRGSTSLHCCLRQTGEENWGQIQGVHPSSAIHPPPMGGTSNSNLIRYMADGSAWLGTMEEYPLHGYCAELEHLILNAGREQAKGGEDLAVHSMNTSISPFHWKTTKAGTCTVLAGRGSLASRAPLP